jgi:hypothetical protein
MSTIYAFRRKMRALRYGGFPGWDIKPFPEHFL